MEDEQSLSEEQRLARRLIAVLDYDGIPKHQRAAFLVKEGKISRSKAYRLLNGYPAPTGWSIPSDLFRALDVNRLWLMYGEFGRPNLRTMRIHLQTYRGYPKEDVDRMMRVVMGCTAGHHKAKNLVNLVAAGELSFAGAARLL